MDLVSCFQIFSNVFISVSWTHIVCHISCHLFLKLVVSGFPTYAGQWGLLLYMLRSHGCIKGLCSKRS